MPEVKFDETPKFLNATLPLKQDPESQERLKQFAAEFRTKWQPKVWEVLKNSRLVHHARFVVIDNKYLQILTEYDGDFIAYSRFFAENLGDFFRAAFSLVEGAPAPAPGQQPDLDMIFRFIKERTDLPCLPDNIGFSAYGPFTVKEIQQKLGITN